MEETRTHLERAQGTRELLLGVVVRHFTGENATWICDEITEEATVELALGVKREENAMTMMTMIEKQ